MRARNPLGPLTAVRVVARPDAIDGARWPERAVTLRIAADEALVIAIAAGAVTLTVPTAAVADEHAIIEDDTSWRGVWITTADALDIIERHADWEAPGARPGLAQGLVAGIAAKVWLGHDESLLVVPASVSSDFEERVR